MIALLFCKDEEGSYPNILEKKEKIKIFKNGIFLTNSARVFPMYIFLCYSVYIGSLVYGLTAIMIAFPMEV